MAIKGIKKSRTVLGIDTSIKKKYRVAVIHASVTRSEPDLTPVRVVADIIKGLKDIEKYEKGEIQLKDGYELLNELRRKASHI